MPVYDMPIYWVGRDGSINKHAVLGSPCIKVKVFPLNPSKPLDVPASALDCWALIDTGADQYFVDRGVLRSLGCEQLPISADTNRGISHVYQAAIYLPDAGLTMNNQVFCQDFMVVDACYRVVLGRQFIRQYCKLVWDGPRMKLRLNTAGKDEYMMN